MNEPLSSLESFKVFKDMPIEIFLENLAKPNEKAVLESTFAMRLNLSSNPNAFGGMCVHIKDGYCASAKHCFEKAIVDIGSKMKFKLEDSQRNYHDVEIELIEAGAPMYEHTRNTPGADWVIFKVISDRDFLKNLPKDAFNPNLGNGKTRAVLAGIPTNIQIHAEGSYEIENIGKQMTTRVENETDFRVRNQRIIDPHDRPIAQEIKVDVGSTNGYSGGPILIDGKYFGGISYATDGTSFTVGISGNWLSERIDTISQSV